jgi:hypothetical protein
VIKLSEDELRLMKLIEHWVDHNDEHGNRFSEEASKAQEIGLSKVADKLREASKASRGVSDILLEALKLLKESGGVV